MGNQIEMLNLAKEKLVEMSANFVPLVIKASLILIVGYFITRWLTRILQRWLGKLEMEPPVRQLLVRVSWLVAMGAFVVLALTNLGIDLLPAWRARELPLRCRVCSEICLPGSPSFSPSRFASENTCP
jgi:small conductance mechanosensitive channel